MGKRIYVGNLPWSVTKEKLMELFSPFGEIEDALVVANKYTGRSRGFGFVTFKDDASASKAIADMDRKDIEGRNIVVKEAMPLRDEMKASGEKIEETKEEKEAVPKEEPKEDEEESKEKKEEKA